MSKLSVHLTDPGNRTGYADFLSTPFNNCSPVSVVYQLNANTKSEGTKYTPPTKFIYRRQSDMWQRLPENFFNGDPVASCNNWMLERRENNRNLVDLWKLNPSDWYDPLNEPVPQTIDQAVWLSRWMVRALEIANANGLKLALFSFSVGRPEYDLWPSLYPALQLGKISGAVLSLHEYGVDTGLITRDESGKLTQYCLDRSLRHRKVYNSLPEDCRIPIVITEAACGNGYAVPLSGQSFVNDAIEYDKEIMLDPYVLCANLFQLGGSESNLQPVLASLTQYISVTPTTTPPVTPPVVPPEETLPYTVTAHLAPQNATIDVMKVIQDKAFATRSTVCQSADDARFLVKHGQTGSKAVIYDPESWPGGTDGILNFFSGCNTDLVYLSQPPIKFDSPIRDIPYRITSKFNDPRNYSNGLHEGMDLDCYDDTISKAVNIYAAQDGGVEQVVTSWSGTGYGIHVVVSHNWYGQIYKTWYCHLASASVSVGQTVTKGTKIGVGGATGTSAIHLHFMIQKIPGGLSGYYTPNVIDPEPITVPNTTPTVPSKRGVGAGNRAVLTSRELDAISISKVDAFLALTMPSFQESAQIVDQVRSKNPNIFVVGRLFFSADYTNKTLFNPQNFVDYCKNGLDGLYSKGVRYFQVHNEPNLVQEGMDWNWKNGVEFASWLNSTLNILRGMYPEAKWGYPGLSPQPNTEQFWADSKAAMNNCDWVGVHSYWQYPGNTGWGMESLDGGYHYKRLSTTKPLMITEFSNNSPTVSDVDKGLQYKSYYSLVNIPAFSFCLSWSGDSNREGWVYNGTLTKIPEKIGT